jgi:hypothetical protein
LKTDECDIQIQASWVRLWDTWRMVSCWLRIHPDVNIFKSTTNWVLP